jgi:hypothetical protein
MAAESDGGKGGSIGQNRGSALPLLADMGHNAQFGPKARAVVINACWGAAMRAIIVGFFRPAQHSLELLWSLFV